VATGQGEDVIRVAGASAVVEFMRQGKSPQEACRLVVEKVRKIKKEKAADIQVCFIALNKKGEHGSYALHSGFNYAVQNNDGNKLIESPFSI
jgi:N4-(beta-N-acetylglucosaminyl)-L-asparaginase